MKRLSFYQYIDVRKKKLKKKSCIGGKLLDSVSIAQLLATTIQDKNITLRRPTCWFITLTLNCSVRYKKLSPCFKSARTLPVSPHTFIIVKTKKPTSPMHKNSKWPGSSIVMTRYVFHASNKTKAAIGRSGVYYPQYPHTHGFLVSPMYVFRRPLMSKNQKSPYRETPPTAKFSLPHPAKTESGRGVVIHRGCLVCNQNKDFDAEKKTIKCTERLSEIYSVL